jgi:hypothetical protein
MADTNAFAGLLKDIYQRRGLPWQPPGSAAGKHLLYVPQDAPGGERLFSYPPAVDPTETSYRIVGSPEEAQAARDVGQRPLIWESDEEPTPEGLRALLNQQREMLEQLGHGPVSQHVLPGRLTQDDLDAMAALVNLKRPTPIAPWLLDQPPEP